MLAEHEISAGRVRGVVGLAAKGSRSARQWLSRDEYGTWERTARDHLTKAYSNPLSATMTAAQIDEACARRLGQLATMALLEYVTKNPPKSVSRRHTQGTAP